LYARKSTDVEDKQVLSIEAQLVELRALARESGLEIVEEFVEKQSAKMPGRPIFNDMMSRISRARHRVLCAGNSTASPAILWTADRLVGFCKTVLLRTYKRMNARTTPLIMC
jgi:hypothetical protein